MTMSNLTLDRCGRRCPEVFKMSDHKKIPQDILDALVQDLFERHAKRNVRS